MPKMNHWRCLADDDVRWVDTMELARHSVRFAREFLDLAGSPAALRVGEDD